MAFTVNEINEEVFKDLGIVSIRRLIEPEGDVIKFSKQWTKDFDTSTTFTSFSDSSVRLFGFV